MSGIIGALAALPLLALTGACSASQPDEPMMIERSPAGLDLLPLAIESNGKTHRFVVEVAQTPEEQAQGLMFRRALAPDRGMLFPYDPAQPASFWMKNTLIPLDILFIRPDGTIARIAEMTEPHSLDPIPSLEPVAAVLEIAGGRAAELGIEEGDRVTWRNQ